MLYTFNLNPNSVVEFLARGGGEKKEGVGPGFLENIKEAIVKESQLQVANKAANLISLSPKKLLTESTKKKKKKSRKS
jgi:hypothetical protein